MVRIIDTAAQLRDEYPQLATPAPIEIKQTALAHPFTQRRDIPLTAPPFREPVSPDHELMRCIAEGDCLLPHIPAYRKCHTFDARLPARDGDYVLVEASADMRRLIELWAEHDELWARKYRDGIPDTWWKQLRLLDGVAWMVERSSAMPLGSCRVLGVLVSGR